MNWFLSSEIENGDLEDSLFHIIPVPFEESVSYGSGTSRGPQAIIEASSQLELKAPEVDPAERGICTLAPLVKAPGISTEEYFEQIAEAHMHSLQMGKIPIQIGGEHSISFPAVHAYRQAYGDLGVIQFDAHADLRESYEGSRLSHACVMRRIIDELELPILQIGIRAYSQEEQRFMNDRSIPVVTGREAYEKGMDAVTIPEGFPKNVFITFDLDALDPSIMPATGTPVPGGLYWYQCQSMFRSIMDKCRIVGFDLVELAPIERLHHCEFTAAQLMYDLMSCICRQG